MKRRRSKRGRRKKGLHKKLWDIFSKFVRLRDKGICFTCGKKEHWKQMNAGHFIHNVLDFDEMNINCQCVKCNLHMHGMGVEYSMRLIKKYGLEKIQDLHNRATKALAGELYTDEWYKEQCEHYQKKVDKLLRKYELDA